MSGYQAQEREQKTFCNKTEIITREARWLLFFKKEALTYNEAYRGVFPEVENYAFRVRVQDVKKFSRKVKNKNQHKNHYKNISIKASYFPINSRDIDNLQGREADNEYIVVLVSNDDMQCFGNHREPMGLKVEDGVRDNGSGKDIYTLVIEGDTTIKRQKQQLPEELQRQYFKVLLYGNPIS